MSKRLLRSSLRPSSGCSLLHIPFSCLIPPPHRQERFQNRVLAPTSRSLLWKDNGPIYFPEELGYEGKEYYAITLTNERSTVALNSPNRDQPHLEKGNGDTPETRDVSGVNERRLSAVHPVNVGPHERFLAPVGSLTLDTLQALVVLSQVCFRARPYT